MMFLLDVVVIRLLVDVSQRIKIKPLQNSEDFFSSNVNVSVVIFERKHSFTLSTKCDNVFSEHAARDTVLNMAEDSH